MQFFHSPNAEMQVPEFVSGEIENESTKNLKKLILLKIIRPDRFIAASKIFVSKVLGEEIL